MRTIFALFLIAPLFIFANDNTKILKSQKQNGLPYIINNGQWHSNVKYRASIKHGKAYFEKDRITFDFYSMVDIAAIAHINCSHNNENCTHNHEHSEASETHKPYEFVDVSDVDIRCHSYQMQFLNCNSNTTITHSSERSEYYNYFLGNNKRKWQGGVKAYNTIEYKNIYNNIDAKFHNVNSTLKYDFIVKPNGNTNNIKLKYTGYNNIEIVDNKLLITTSVNTIEELMPIVYQIIDGEQIEIACNYVLNNNIVSFAFPNGYDHTKDLIIDPVLIGSTFAGAGSTEDWNFGSTATYDADGNIYLGTIPHETVVYPTTIGAYIQSYTGGFITGGIMKFNDDASQLIYCTYLGGNDTEQPMSLFVKDYELYVYGYTKSTDFPTTTNAHSTSNSGGSDIVVTHFNTTGTDIIGSTYVGGSEDDGLNYAYYYDMYDKYRGEIIVLDNGSCLVTSNSKSTNFPTTTGALQTSMQGESDGVIIKLNADLSVLENSTYFGSADDDMCYGIREDSDGNIYVSGTCGAALNLYDWSAGAMSNYLGGQFSYALYDAFVIKLSSDLSTLLNNSYYSTTAADQAFFVDIYETVVPPTSCTNGYTEKSIYICGVTQGNINVTPGVFSHSDKGPFIAKFNDDLSNIEFQTALGGNYSVFYPVAFMVDKCKRIYVSGHKAGTGLAITPDHMFNANNINNLYIAVLLPDAVGLAHATYVPGCPHVDGGTSRFNPEGVIYQAVCTDDEGADFGDHYPTASNAYSTANQSDWDAAVFKIDFEAVFVEAEFEASSDSSNLCAPIAVNFNNLSSSNASNFVWDFGDGTTSTDQNPTHTYTNQGTYTPMLIAIDSMACNMFDTICFDINIIECMHIIASDTSICNSNPAQVSVEVFDGVEPFTYQWSGGLPATAGPHVVNPTITTDYYITVTDAVGNIDIDTATVEIFDNINSNYTSISVTCFGGNNGEIDLTVLNGSAPYTFDWDNDGTGDTDDTEDINTLTQGTYNLTITDANTCTGTNTIIISEPTQLILQITNTNISCFGYNNGTATVTANGGTTPYTYIWTNNDSLNVADSLSMGTHQVIVTDANQCVDSVSVNITEPTDLQLTLVDTDADCGLNNGSMDLTVSGGTAGYIYDWDNDGTGDNDDAQNLSGLSVGTYTVIVYDANMCNDTISDTITQPASFTLSETHINNICYQGNTGSIDLSETGTSTTFTYDWDNDGTGDNDDTQDLSDLTAGQYSVIVTDENNCQVSLSVDITEPLEITLSANHTNTLCFGSSDGSITITATNGTAPYQYSIDDVTYQASNIFNNLTEGNYTIYITDNNGCTSQIYEPIYEPTQLVSSANPTNISCFGNNDGEIDLDIYGGTPPYTYDWSNSTHNQDVNNLSQNIYFVTVIDANNCTIIDTGKVTEPLEIGIIPTSNSILCYGDLTGIINIEVTGGVLPYIYNWSNLESTQDLNNIPAGQYTVTVTDNSACTKLQSITVTEPNQLVTSLPNNYTHCNNDESILASVEGGVTPYTYNWGTGETTDEIEYTPNETQTYTITVTDANNCTSIDEITITIISVNLNVYANKDTVCPGDPIIVTTNIQGGMSPYTIYDNGQISTFPVIIYPNGQENYTLQVVDACGNTDNAIIDVYTYPIVPLSFTADKLQGCPPLKINFNQHYYSNYSNYIWNFDNIDENNLSFNINPTHIFTESGLYDISVQVTDSNGCKNQLTIENMIEIYPKPKAMFEPTPEIVSFINPTIDFDNYSINNYNNYWYFDDGNQTNLVNPSHEYTSAGIYYPMLIVETNKGCLDTAIHKVEVQDEFILYVPTAFSPDGDAINDGFRAVGHGIDLDNYFIAVYDRWGELIWESNDLFENWDGTAKKGTQTIQNGAYKWLIICKDFNGVEHTKSGNVTVIR